MVRLVSVNLSVYCPCPPHSETLIKELSPLLQPWPVISSQPSRRSRKALKIMSSTFCRCCANVLIWGSSCNSRAPRHLIEPVSCLSGASNGLSSLTPDFMPSVHEMNGVDETFFIGKPTQSTV